MKIRNAVLALACTVLACASLLQAQQNEQLTASVIPNAGPSYGNSNPPTSSANTSDAPAANPPEPGFPQAGSAQGSTGGTAQDSQWHFSLSPYLYFPGVHGTVGAFDRDASYRASAADMLSHFRFGVMGAGEARRNRLLLTLDLMYMRLGDNQAIPFPNLLANTANFTANLVVLTPKVGVRLINFDKFKADFLTGIRYWYFGENLNFTPSRLGLNFSKSQNWVDPLVGGRIQGDLTPKVGVTVLGDVGGWGTGSQLEYQVAGLLGYKLKSNLTLQAGYRYMYFDKEKGGPAGAFVQNAMSGVIVGATLNLK
jgi:hypothetical protein